MAYEVFGIAYLELETVSGRISSNLGKPRKPQVFSMEEEWVVCKRCGTF